MTIRILVVGGRHLDARLRDLGYDVVGVVASGPEAIAFAASKTPDLILISAKLDGPLDGQDTAQVIRDLLSVPVFELQPGAPYSDRELNTSIAAALKSHSHERELAARNQHDRAVGLAMIAGSLSHEINNPLASVVANVGYAQQVLRKHRGAMSLDADEVDFALRDATRAAERVHSLINELAKLALPERAPAEEISLASVIEQAVAAAHAKVRQPFPITTYVYCGPVTVRANAGLLTQAVTNVLVNAIEAIFRAGAADGRVSVSLKLVRGRVVIEVRDTGDGIPKDTLPRVFDLFFTTKALGDGLGLGLSVARRVVNAIGGEIQATTDAAGTLIAIELPVVQAAADLDKTVDLAPPRARILIIDDDVLICRSLARILQKKHDVTVETDPRRALGAASAQKFDLIFCDVMMPEMLGVDLYHALVAANPDAAERIVFITGGAFSPATRELVERAGRSVMMKPISPDKVQKLTSSLLQQAHM